MLEDIVIIFLCLCCTRADVFPQSFCLEENVYFHCDYFAH